MRSFLKKITVFIFILFVFNIIIGLFLPTRKYYGNEMFEQKFLTIQNNINSYNVYFFGSSRIANGVRPQVFDSIMQESGRNVNSYNLASYGTWFNENNFILNSLLKDTTVKDATFVIEFQQVMSVRWDKIDRHKNIYYQDFHNFTFIFNYVLEREVNTIRDLLVDLHYIFAYTISGTLKIFNLGEMKGLNTAQNHSIEFDDKGFFAVESRKKIHENTVNKYLSESIHLFQTKNKEKSNAAFLSEVLNMIEKAKEKNISVIFILNPKNFTEEMVANYEALPSENKIDYHKFFDQASLFDVENWGDNTHFNLRGAHIFTEYIAKEILLLDAMGDVLK